jgi:glycosyltransferase involved in cell wall biosynthesis
MVSGMDASCDVHASMRLGSLDEASKSSRFNRSDAGMLNLPTYVLITPARNEAQFIELTIKSVVAQTIRPLKWVIVSDGSTDGTDDIVKKYADQHDWIELVRMPERRERNFAGKVHAFNAGYARIRGLAYEVIGSLDGDASFDEGYFAFLLQKLAEDPVLGLVGTAFREISQESYDYRFVGIEHVTGICQLFRRACYEETGGYVAVKGGAVDRIVNIAARIKGWKTRTFTEKMYIHHRQMGTAQQGVLKACFTDGAKDYSVGSHPLWEFFRTIYQMTRTPLVLGGLMLACGYVWALIRRVERPVSGEMVKFHRREQMQRLRKFLTGKTIFQQSDILGGQL